MVGIPTIRPPVPECSIVSSAITTAHSPAGLLYFRSSFLSRLAETLDRDVTFQ